jgi:serine/threonine-protein kinase
MRTTEACPGREELRAFQAGRLDEGRLHSLAEHLGSCAGCLRALEGLPDEETVVSRLRRLLPRPADPPDPLCERLAAAARGIALEADGSVTALLRPGGPPGGAEARPAVRAFGGHELLERLGQGGMGVVWKARQVRLNRLVALKMVRFPEAADAHALERFRREGEAVARLAHPNVVEVYDSGEHDGQPYYSMELLEGGSLARRVAAGPLPPREACGLVRTLALAMQAAHDRKIVHRDLKPANVLFATDGTPKITDFGLAKLLDADAGQTQTGDVMGTASYMSPEQARGDAGLVGPPTDVYALGAILYELLAGRPPFRGPTRVATLEQVRTREPPPLAGAAPREAAGLEAVCRKCLEKEPARRYESAAALADDLGRWLDGQPTAARRSGRPPARGRTLRRRAFLGAALGACGLGAAGLAGFWFWKSPSPIDDLEAQLAEGKTVTPVGPTGPPVWSRWAVNNDSATAATAADGAFTLRAWGPCLLELVRDPRRDHFRFRAEVRHAETTESGAVGLFVAHRTFSTPEGDVHLFVKLTFNDVLDEAKEYDRLFAGVPGPPPRPLGNLVRLHPVLCGRDSPASIGTRLLSGDHGELVRPPVGWNGNVWRRLEVEASPDGVLAWWDGAAGAPSLTLPAKDVANAVGEQLAVLAPNFPALKGMSPALTPRGSLGFFLANGVASLRSVVIEPLATVA